MAYWLSILVNGGFALLFFNRLINTDYEEDFDNPYLFWVFDGLCFALNLAAFLVTITS